MHEVEIKVTACSANGKTRKNLANQERGQRIKPTKSSKIIFKKFKVGVKRMSPCALGCMAIIFFPEDNN